MAGVYYSFIMFGICLLSVIPCRKEPSHRSEMVTQLLFGEHFVILKEEKDWYNIKNIYDGYESWIEKKQCALISEDTCYEINTPQALSLDLVHPVRCISDNNLLPIVLGSTLPLINERLFFIEELQYEFTGSYTEMPIIPNRKKIIETACTYLNTPYLWGGRSPFGIDCSGFTQMVYKINGYKLPRDAYQQAEHGITLNFVDEAIAGDLAFFDNEEGRITHVGIMMSDKKIIHASGKVRIDSIDHQGIFNKELNKYTHNLRVIKKTI